jgi:two-component system sensor histidine kinase EvgS
MLFLKLMMGRFKITNYLTILIALFLLGCSASKRSLKLTKEEQLFLEETQLSVSVFPNSPPYAFIEDDRVVGIFIDFISLIEERVGYDIKRSYFSNWPSVIEAGKKGTVDIISEIQSTAERRKHFLFTEPLIKHPHSILVSKVVEGNVGLNSLKDRPIVVVNGYAIHEYLKMYYPNLNLLPQRNEQECLKKLSSGETYAYVARHAVATHMIQSLGFPYVRIAGEVPYDNELGFAVSKDKELLQGILNKAIKSISREEYKGVVDKWLYEKYIPFYMQVEFWIFIAFCVTVAFMVMWFFNTVLKQKVRTRTEELVAAKVKAEESDQLKSAFIANMSHEIRTPLNGIMGFADLLNDDSFSEEERQSFKNLIKSNSTQLMHLVNDIIDISKIESRQLNIYKTQFSVWNLMTELHNKFIWESKDGVDLVLETEEDFVMFSDELRIQQVLINFLSNAMKFTDKGSVRMGVEKYSENMLCFYVKDTGIGIPLEKQKDLFKPFYQVGDFLTRKHGGAGLGLAISYRLAQLLEGRLELESEAGAGSTFKLIVPLELSKLAHE